MIKLVCIDSDGCAIDSMNIKHDIAFGDELVRVFNVEKDRARVKRIWEHFNLFSLTRGNNRFITLLYTLRELNALNILQLDPTPLSLWIESTKSLSNEELKAEVERTGSPLLQKALEWSLSVNRAINAIPKSLIKPFCGVIEALSALKGKAQINILSSANLEAVKDEWSRFGLLDYIAVVYSQRDGSKSQCLKDCLDMGLKGDEILVIGDSPGDAEAAKENGALFFPILVNREEESWREFIATIAPTLSSSYLKEKQESYSIRFINNLKGEK